MCAESIRRSGFFVVEEIGVYSSVKTSALTTQCAL